VEPVNFRYNEQTALTNALMRHEEDNAAQVEALEQVNNYVAMLREHGIKVVVVKDTPEPVTPDSIFPNNWFSTHEEGTVVLYPMCAPNRRAERKRAVIDAIYATCPNYRVEDLTTWEGEGKFLEGTGSLVLDRVNKIAYSCLSPRTSAEALDDFCRRMGYAAVTFCAVDASGVPVYHTNVMMCVGTDFAILCEESITSPEELGKVKSSLEKAGKRIIPISLAQMSSFAGNMLELNDGKGSRYVVMSETARTALTESQIARISECCRIISADIHTIETNAGGSVRCMLAEIY